MEVFFTVYMQNSTYNAVGIDCLCKHQNGLKKIPVFCSLCTIILFEITLEKTLRCY